MPSPRKDESQSDFVHRCMTSAEAKRQYPDEEQRISFCYSQWRNKEKPAKESKRK